MRVAIAFYKFPIRILDSSFSLAQAECLCHHVGHDSRISLQSHMFNEIPPPKQYSV